MQFSLFEKLNSLNFDQIYIKKCKHLWYKVSTIRLVIEYIFIINLFKYKTFYYKLGQTWANLTGTDFIIAFFCRWRVYLSYNSTTIFHQLPCIHVPLPIKYVPFLAMTRVKCSCTTRYTYIILVLRFLLIVISRQEAIHMKSVPYLL